MSRKNLYIIGARGFGRDFAWWCKTTPGVLDQYRLVGFLDDKADALDGFREYYPPIVGKAESFRPGEDDVLFCAMGNVKYKVGYTELMLAKGGKFDRFISPSAYIHPSATIGEGTFIWQNVVVGSDAQIGRHVICQSFAIIGHDNVVGDYCIFDTQANCCGFVTIGDRTALHTGAKVAPHVSIGSDVTLGIGSVVIRDVKDGQTVFGNPARPVLAPKA